MRAISGTTGVANFSVNGRRVRLSNNVLRIGRFQRSCPE
jgi:hypothetical protein